MPSTDLTTPKGRKYPRAGSKSKFLQYPVTISKRAKKRGRYFSCLHVGQRDGDGGLLGGRREELLEGVLRGLVLGPHLEPVEGDPLGHRVDGQPLLRDLLAQPSNLVVPPLAELQ